jgi:hypothetical protein
MNERSETGGKFLVKGSDFLSEISPLTFPIQVKNEAVREGQKPLVVFFRKLDQQSTWHPQHKKTILPLDTRLGKGLSRLCQYS